MQLQIRGINTRVVDVESFETIAVIKVNLPMPIHRMGSLRLCCYICVCRFICEYRIECYAISHLIRLVIA